MISTVCNCWEDACIMWPDPSGIHRTVSNWMSSSLKWCFQRSACALKTGNCFCGSLMDFSLSLMRGENENNTIAPRQWSISLFFSRVCKRGHIYSVTNNWLPFSLLSEKKKQGPRFAHRLWCFFVSDFQCGAWWGEHSNKWDSDNKRQSCSQRCRDDSDVGWRGITGVNGV